MGYKRLIDFRKSGLVRASFYYTATNFISKAFPFILLPFLARTLSLSEYGTFSIYRATANICLPLIGLSLSEAVVRFYYDRNEIDFKLFLSTVLILEISSFLLAITLLYLSPSILISELGIEREIVAAALFIGVANSVNNVDRGLLRCEGNLKSFSLLVVGQAGLYFVAVMGLYFAQDLNLSAAILCEVLVFVGFMFLGVYNLFKRYDIRFDFNLNYGKRAFSYSFPLLIHSLLAFTFALSDRYIINYILGKDEVAIYSVSFQIASVLQILAVSFNSAWTPWVYENLKKGVSNRKLKKGQILVGGVFIVLGVVYWACSYKFLPLFAGDQYSRGIYLLGWFIGANILQALYWICAPILKYYNKNWLLIWSSVPALVISIVLNICFIPKFGILAAAIVYFLSWLVIFTITIYASLKTQLKYVNSETDFANYN